MNRWRIGAAALAAVIIMTSCTPNVVPDGFQLLGRREVNFGIDRDSIEVNRAAGPLRQLMITAKMNPVEVLHHPGHLREAAPPSTPTSASAFSSAATG